MVTIQRTREHVLALLQSKSNTDIEQGFALIYEYQSKGKTLLKDAMLGPLDLWNAPLKQIQLPGVKLREAKLREIDLEMANLAGADLTRADLSAANLYLTDLHKANLEYTNCAYAGFIGTNLENANLRHADLSDARFVETNLKGADLTGVSINEGTFWQDVQIDTKTILPESLKIKFGMLAASRKLDSRKTVSISANPNKMKQEKVSSRVSSPRKTR